MKQLMKSALIAFAAGAALSAQAKITDGTNYGDWKGVCEKDTCGVVQVVKNDQDKPISQIVIRKVAEAKNAPTLFITLPLGVNLRAGVQFAVDGKKVGVIPYDFCFPGGCNAAAPIEDKVIQQMKAGKKLQVTTYLGAQKQDVDFSLSGFTKALNSL